MAERLRLMAAELFMLRELDDELSDGVFGIENALPLSLATDAFGLCCCLSSCDIFLGTSIFSVLLPFFCGFGDGVEAGDDPPWLALVDADIVVVATAAAAVVLIGSDAVPSKIF